MSMSTTPTTKLEAVNQCLAAIGEAPVNRVDDSGLADADVALRTLSNVSREVQQAGWHWNTEINLPLAPDVDGFLSVPANTLRVDTVGNDRGTDVVQRGQRLYDRANHTYVFTRPVTVELVVLLDFEEIPEAARNYIALRAARRFQQNSVGSPELSGFQAHDEVLALVALQNSEAETQDYNIFQSGAVRRIIRR